MKFDEKEAGLPYPKKQSPVSLFSLLSIDKGFILYYIVYMVLYSEDISKRVSKRLIPSEVFIHFNNAFSAIDLTHDLNLFDIKQLKTSTVTTTGTKRIYYRIRKGKYRAIFYFDGDTIMVIALDKREEVYKKWQ